MQRLNLTANFKITILNDTEIHTSKWLQWQTSCYADVIRL